LIFEYEQTRVAIEPFYDQLYCANRLENL
jgi:hypothetical protein